MVELDARSGMVGKTTLPPAFGLIPEVVNLPLAKVRPDADCEGFRQAIEFLNATPLEYLVRWVACNEVFGDQVKLAAVIRWTDGLVSFGITQPQYHGTPADPREIEGLFLKAGWSRLADPSGHTVFFNHAFGVLAIDAERRNCFVNDGGLQPFDVILCNPTNPWSASSESIRSRLQIWIDPPDTAVTSSAIASSSKSRRKGKRRFLGVRLIPQLANRLKSAQQSPKFHAASGFSPHSRDAPARFRARGVQGAMAYDPPFVAGKTDLVAARRHD